MNIEIQLLYEYLGHRYQFLLPEFKSCPIEFLKQIEAGYKKAIPLSQVRDFYLPNVTYVPTKASDLHRHCLSKPWLKEYVYENKILNREFLIKVIATFELETLLELNKLILQKKFHMISIPITVSAEVPGSLTDDKKIEVKDDEVKKNKEEDQINDIELEKILDIMEEIENEIE
jgi:hypothetical protein